MWLSSTMNTSGMIPEMSDPILIDTSAFYALISATDPMHPRAQQQYQDLIDHDVDLFTTSYVLLETIALTHRRLGLTKLEALVESIRSVVRTYWVTQSVHDEAWNMLRVRGGRQLSFVDCSTIVVAHRLKAAVFAFDEDFSREGLALIPR